MFRLLLAAVAALLFSAPAQAVTYGWNWTGDCIDSCTGSATGVLTLNDPFATPLTFTIDQFVSLDFTSSAGSWLEPNDTMALQRGPNNTAISNGIRTLPDGTFLFVSFIQFVGDLPFYGFDYWEYVFRHSSSDTLFSSYQLRGEHGQFTADFDYEPPVTPVPIPTGLPMLAGALGLLGLVARARRSGDKRTSLSQPAT